MGADTLHNLADSMPQRIAAVARARGDYYRRSVSLRKYMTLAKHSTNIWFPGQQLLFFHDNVCKVTLGYIAPYT